MRVDIGIRSQSLRESDSRWRLERQPLFGIHSIRLCASERNCGNCESLNGRLAILEERQAEEFRLKSNSPVIQGTGSPLPKASMRDQSAQTAPANSLRIPVNALYSLVAARLRAAWRIVSSLRINWNRNAGNEEYRLRSPCSEVPARDIFGTNRPGCHGPHVAKCV